MENVFMVFAVVFLVSPLLGYWVITSQLSVERKVLAIFAGMFVLTVLPLIVLLIGGSSL